MAEDRIEVDTGTSELLCEIRDRVALITLNRPEARNAQNRGLLVELDEAFKAAEEDDALPISPSSSRVAGGRRGCSR